MIESGAGSELNPEQRVDRMEKLASHIWMVRTFLKHSEEGEEDDELREVYRDLYDFLMALGGPQATSGADHYLKLARKKFRKLESARQLFEEIQPEISSHTNFRMAVQSLNSAVSDFAKLLHPGD